MTLLDRIARQVGLGGDKIPGHTIEAALGLYLTGATGVTRQKVIDFFSIPASMETDFDKFKTKYDGLVGAAAKGIWLRQLTDCVILLQQEERNTGRGITRANFNTILGLDLDAT